MQPWEEGSKEASTSARFIRWLRELHREAHSRENSEEEWERKL